MENLEGQATAVAQILPTLATKADLNELKIELKAEWKADIAEAIAPLATKAELQAAIAPLATKAEVKAEGETTRRYFDVVAEGLRTDIRPIAEKLDATEAKVDARHADVMRILPQHDRRLTRPEASSASQL